MNPLETALVELVSNSPLLAFLVWAYWQERNERKTAVGMLDQARLDHIQDLKGFNQEVRVKDEQ